MNIGAGLMRKGKSVLFVDADQQGSLTLGFGIDTKGKNTLYEVLKENCKTTDAIIKTSNGSHIIPSDLMLARAEAELALEPGRDMLMSEALAQNTTTSSSTARPRSQCQQSTPSPPRPRL